MPRSHTIGRRPLPPVSATADGDSRCLPRCPNPALPPDSPPLPQTANPTATRQRLTCPSHVQSSHLGEAAGNVPARELARTNVEYYSKSHEIDIEEIIKAAREAAATRSKERILKQIRGDQASEMPAQEGHDSDRASVSTRGEVEPQNEAKKHQRNANRGAKKGYKKETGELPEPGPSKRAKLNMGEQINAIVQECFKSMGPLLFAKPGGARNMEGPGGGEPRGDITPNDIRERGAPAAKAATPPERCPSPSRGRKIQRP
ncbi:hypothetical protein NDU88_001092 [Pleurodeles waltl]|uniref:Uncharacterized protein n=1 Tax=Pleurodeles waltl TaxID=8319 RepID=A0AAV7LEX0_PLEWA|nr:hypothetical protein NDU88_001092 [Pleurodeles waltl]